VPLPSRVELDGVEYSTGSVPQRHRNRRCGERRIGDGKPRDQTVGAIKRQEVLARAAIPNWNHGLLPSSGVSEDTVDSVTTCCHVQDDGDSAPDSGA
jgi:hypothetical protein